MNIDYQIILPRCNDLAEITDYLVRVDEQFKPPLHTRVNIENYAKKVFEFAHFFMARDRINGKLIGFAAAYLNKKPEFSFATFLSVLPEYQGEDFVGINLINELLKYAKEYGGAGVQLAIRESDKLLFKFYKRKVFVIVKENFYPNSTEKEFHLQLIY